MESLVVVDVVQAVAAISLGNFVQGAAGFGAGVLSIPLMLWLGFPLPHAVIANMVAVFFQCALGCYKLRDHVPWKTVGRMYPARAVFFFIGVYAMGVLNVWPPDTVKQVVGGCILMTLLALRFYKPSKPSLDQAGGRGQAWAVGAVSGFTGGTIGMGGPPLVLWSLTKAWSPAQSRSFFWANFMAVTPLAMPLYLWRFGDEATVAIITGLMAMPVVLLSARAGIAVGNRLPRKRLRQVTAVLLLTTATSALAAPWL